MADLHGLFGDQTHTAAPSPLATPPVFTVGELNATVRELLEDSFPLIRVEGEISNLARPASGHLYFSLKDEQAQIRCALFRRRAPANRTTVENGKLVRALGRLSLYVPRGDYQLIVDEIEDAGEGALQRAFEALKRRLAAEGLFDEDRKRPLPAFPRCVGVVSSPGAAALRDILNVLKRRFPGLPVLLYPTPVQGEAAPARIAECIRLASRRRDCDVLLVARGGGSLEDLQAFNEEVVARAIADCDIPVVTGIGHQTDFTIADFVADLRAPTPSAAAEVISPDREELLKRLGALTDRLTFLLSRRLQMLAQRMDWLDRRLAQQHPRRRFAEQRRRLGESRRRLGQAMGVAVQSRLARLSQARTRLLAASPERRLGSGRQRLENLTRRLQGAMRYNLESAARRLQVVDRALGAVGPQATLERGYAILSPAQGGAPVTEASQAPAGTKLRARLARGALRVQVLPAGKPGGVNP